MQTQEIQVKCSNAFNNFGDPKLTKFVVLL